MSIVELKIPEIGENIRSGTVVKINMAVGHAIKKGQDLLELETDKATIPIPSSVDGKIQEILVKEGQTVKVGQVVLKIESQTTGATAKPEAKPEKAAQELPSPQKQEALFRQTEEPKDRQPPVGTDKPVDLIVVGGGPGGYAAAFLAADLGMNVTLVDKEKSPGGVCLFRGCIPSKALLHVAKILSESREAKEIGIEFAEPKIHIDKVREWKESVVTRLTGGLGQLCKQRKIHFVQGQARFLSSQSLEVQKSDGSKETLKFDYAIVATGSYPVKLPFAVNSPRILDSTTALNLENIPKRLLVIGGGYIGLELGTVYHELGSKVSVVEMLPGILLGADPDLAKILEVRIKKHFEKIMVNTKVTKMEENSTGIKVTFEDKDGKSSTEEYEKVLVAIGRKPNSQNLGLENTKVTVNQRGFVEVDLQRRTSDPFIFAIGDIAGDPMLAHKASHEGRVAVETIAGHAAAFEPAAIPAVVFTDPEIAWCGLTELEAQKQGRHVKVIKFPWGASGRAITLNRPDGLTKLIIDPETERILGVAIAGVGAGEMIAEGVLAVEMATLASDLKLSIHPHPTLSETIMETAEGFFGQSTHIYRPKK